MQQELFGWRPRGGWREGAGRKRTSSFVPHRSRERFRNGVCHVTLRLGQGLPTLRSKRVARAFRLGHYSLQRNHVHLIAEAENAAALGRGVRALGIRLARAANRIWSRRGPVIADRYHFRLLRTPREVRNALRYVLLNVRKHVRSHTGSVHPDPASSGPWFEAWEEYFPRPRAPSPVAKARSWLLGQGWLRHGRISLAEAPSG